jgi:transposase InsO family protein
MGYNLADNMKAEESERALNMVIKNYTSKSEPTIHHSDRGLQY